MRYRFLNKRFSILESFVFVSTIGVLIAIISPEYIVTTERIKSQLAVTDIHNIRKSLDRSWYQNGFINTRFDYLDIADPNDNPDRLYTYSITDNGTDSLNRRYTITAAHTTDAGRYEVRWVQTDNNTGVLYKSANLGGRRCLR